MPSGRTHDRITLWSLPIVAGSAFMMTRHSAFTLFICIGFLLGGLLLGPDLDTHSIHYKRWGWLRWIWLPYRYRVRHRSPWSHSPVLGTTVRVLYLMAWIGAISLVGLATLNEVVQLGWSWSEIGGFWQQSLWQHHQEAIALFIGLEVGAFSHYTADYLVSTHKRVRSKGFSALLPKRKPKKRKRRRSTRKR